MPLTPAQRRAKDKYDKKAYDEIRIKPRKEIGAKIRAHVEERGESLTGFMTRAAETQIELDKNSENE